MHLLPQSILSDIFNTEYKLTDISIDYLIDELELHDVQVIDHDNYDCVVVIRFTNDKIKLEGELRINRIMQHFDIIVRIDDIVFLPAIGDWNMVIEYLNKAISSKIGN